MAGERMPHSLNSNPSCLSETSGSNQTHEEERRAADGGNGSTLNDKAGHTGKGGKLRLSRPALFRKKPYDRPVHPGGLGISSSLNGHTPSLPSRLVDSASNLIVSSASYLFESFFKRRRTLWIDDGTRSTARMNSADMEHKECSKPPSDNLEEDTVPALQGPGVEACHEKAEGEDSDLAKLEGILKQKSLSREEVKRLSDVLRNQSSGGHVNLEALRRQEKIQQVGEEPNPVQLAKAYMGEHTARFVSMPSRRQSTPYRYGEGAGPSSVKRIKEDVYGMSPMKAFKSGLASAERMLKRRLIADDDDNVTSKGPTRRVRQKMTIMPNSSPYIRQLNAGRGLRTSSTPFVQRIEKAEALEEPKLPAKGIFMEEPAVVAACNVEDPAEASKARENSESLSKNDSLVLPTSSDVDKFSCKPALEDVEPVVPITSKATAENFTTGSLVASPPQLPAVTEKSKGFRMSAFFEDSSSDEESGSAVKMPPSTEAQQLGGSSIFLGALEENTQNQPRAPIFNDGSFSSAPEFTKKASLTLLQPINAGGLSNATFSSSPASFALAMQSSESPLLTNLKPLPGVSYAPSAATEKEFLPSTPSASARAPSSVVFSTPPILASPLEETTLPASSVSFSLLQGAVLPSSSLAEAEKPLSIQNAAAAEAVEGGKSGFSPVTASISAKTIATETPSLVAPSFTAPATTSEPSVALATTAASVSPVGCEPSSTGMRADVPVVFQASTGGAAQVDTMAAPQSFIKAGGGVTFTSGSPGADRQAEGDTMATDPMSEEPDSSFVSSSASPFLFGLSSTPPTPTPLGQVPSFGSNASLGSSPFLFSTPSSAPSGASSSSAQFSFGSQSSNAAGQLFPFGPSASPPSNHFAVNAQSSFSFSSSAAPSTSPVFTATSSAPVTFPATPAVPSFQFGASSPSTSSASMFGAPMTEAAGAFAAPVSQSNSSAFVFATPPTSSGTPSPPFQFGGAGASGLSFGGQTFTFGGGQPAHAASNPFAQSGSSNAAPFQFGASAPTPSQSVFPSGNTTPPSLSFGAQQPSASPFPFAFGAQPGAPATGQPFSFGGQPAAPAQSPFSLPGATGQNTFPSAGASGMDFAGGFSLGAVGAEKPGRKFIKAKRIGGGKRGK